MEKEQKQELGWRVSVLPIPAFHCHSGMQEWVIQIPSIPILVSVLFPSLHQKYFRIKFLLLVCIVFENPTAITSAVIVLTHHRITFYSTTSFLHQHQ